MIFQEQALKVIKESIGNKITCKDIMISLANQVYKISQMKANIYPDAGYAAFEIFFSDLCDEIIAEFSKIEDTYAYNNALIR